MAKRNRGSRSSHRPGGQGPARTRKTSDAATPASADLLATGSDADIDEAIDMVEMAGTEITIEEGVPAAPSPRRQRKNVRVRSDSLQARVAAENVYVREDLRRIGLVSAVLIGSLAVAWVLFVPLNLLDLY